MKYWPENNDTAVLKFYGTISQWWNGANDFTDTLKDIECKFKNLKIRLHCYGGEVIEGNVIFNAIAQSPLNITWQIDGVAASMGSIIPLSKGKITMCDNAFVMIHVPNCCSDGNANDHISTAKLLRNMEANFLNTYSKKSGKPVKELEYLMNGSDHWFTAQECLDMKLVDAIITATDLAVDIHSKPDAATPVENVYARYKAIALTAPAPIITKTIRNMDKVLLITRLGLTTVNAESSDTAVIDAVIASITGKDAEIGSLKTAAADGIKVQAAAMIKAKAAFIKTVFTEVQEKEFMAVAEKAGIGTLTTVLEAMKATPVISSMVTEEGKNNLLITEDRSSWTLAQWEEKDGEGLEKLTDAAKGKLYAAAFPGAK